MYQRLETIAGRIWPGLYSLPDQSRVRCTGDILGFLTTLPLAVASLIWLALITPAAAAGADWTAVLFTAVLLVVVMRLDFFVIIDVRGGRTSVSSGNLDELVLWAGLFLAGPIVLWTLVAWNLIAYALRLHRSDTPENAWNALRNLVTILSTVLSQLVAYSLYIAWGGQVPISGLEAGAILPALGALAVHFALSRAFWAGYLAYYLWMNTRSGEIHSRRSVIRFLITGNVLPGISYPFSILAAGLYVQNGPGGYLFFMAGVVLVGILARQLSRSAETSRQQSRQLEQLEHLSRAIINAPPDGSTLSDLLSAHVPAIYPSARAIEVRIHPSQTLLRTPDGAEPVPEDLWSWLRGQHEAHAFLRPARLPWNDQRLITADALLVVPIEDVEGGKPLGGIALHLGRGMLPWTTQTTAAVLVSLKSLADAIASALHRADIYAQTLSYQQAVQELSFAGQIQERFLPETLPEIPGWQLTAMLKPARQASGDFYDVILLPNGMVGLVVADVADKGMGAALYMALSRTLLRTYAQEWSSQTALAFSATNRRILGDTYADQFVTVFYGVLDPTTGRLHYSNAGHNPPFLFGSDGEGPRQSLIRTGPPLGIATGLAWTQGETRIAPGETLVLYTDGITEAQNPDGDFYGPERLIGVVQAQRGADAAALQSALLADVRRFVGSAPQVDDITLMVLARAADAGDAGQAQPPIASAQTITTI